MIPVDYKESIKYTDSESGMVFELAPVVGDTEHCIMSALDSLDNTRVSTCNAVDEIFNLSVRGWSHPSKDVPAFPLNQKPSNLFPFKYKKKMVFDVILEDAKHLDSEEKKS